MILYLEMVGHDLAGQHGCVAGNGMHAHAHAQQRAMLHLQPTERPAA
jgi:hypothetical protein